jgi:hypothetical protein
MEFEDVVISQSPLTSIKEWVEFLIHILEILVSILGINIKILTENVVILLSPSIKRFVLS